MADTWRLIIDGALDGALNMALDRAAQLAREDGVVPPTLRLYRWARPTITLGRFQRLAGVDADTAREEGVDVVRRFTGGRGVLHDDEVTYSVVASVEDGVPRGCTASYRHLCAALAAAYRSMGVNAQVTQSDGHVSASASCYLTTTRADLTVGGHKLAGSAQVWSGSTVLQHGSVIRSRDAARESRVFSLDESEAKLLTEQTVSLDTLLGSDVSTGEIVQAIVDGFATALGISIVPGRWTPHEASIASRLLKASPGSGGIHV